MMSVVRAGGGLGFKVVDQTGLDYPITRREWRLVISRLSLRPWLSLQPLVNLGCVIGYATPPGGSAEQIGELDRI